jgi:hypothetical protein
MAKQLEANEDWVKRDYGRVPTKGAMAAERASAGLGVRSDEAVLRDHGIPLPPPLPRPAQEPDASRR